MTISQILIIVELQMRKKVDASMSCSSAFKMAINHKPDRQIAVMEWFIITIF